MKKILFASISLLSFLVLSQFILASSFDVSLTGDDQIAFTFEDNLSNWQLASIDLLSSNNDLILEFDDYIYFQDGSAVQIVDCIQCNPGNYSVIATLNSSKYSSNLLIEKASFDWFWAFIIVLVSALALAAKCVFRNEPLSSLFSKSFKKNKSTSKPKKRN